MSGPVSTADAPPVGRAAEAEPACVELSDSRETFVGEFRVRRALPKRGRRTVGAWCFVDHMGPGTVSGDRGIGVGPHPHIGLQTVTWLLAGEVLHRDSLGSEQVIRPGQLNLMTAGRGVAHAEEGTGRYRGELHGVQLWVAQPSATREGDPAFEHHASLPVIDVGSGVATVLVGPDSPARRDTDHVGLDLDLRAGRAELPLEPAHEHAVVVFSGAVRVGDAVVEPGRLAYLGAGRDECRLSALEPTRALLIGGTPFAEPVLMWWNYVARTREEIVGAHRDWSSGRTDRFGAVASSLARIDTAGPPW